MDSILNYVKKNIGLTEECKDFDSIIITHINSVLATLPDICEAIPEPYSISDEYAVWSNIYPSDDPKWNVIGTYVWMKVKLSFDPPLSQAHITALKEQINEIEWRLSTKV